MKKIIACLFLIFFASNTVADARHHEDQDKAREAVERGGVATYAELEQVISRQFKGRIIRVELDKDWSEWLYKLRLLEDDGRIIKIEVNAKDLQVIEMEGRKLENIVINP